jgi:hypothetical protein
VKTITIIVSPTGETSLETKGFAGAECLEASRFVEEALGKRQSEQLTGEFHASQSVQQNARQSN